MTDSYYGRPILKEPVWKAEIPAYLFTGGLTGASSLVSLAARWSGNRRLARTSLYIGLACEIVNPVLLIRDLGRPERFLNMLRVFKVTSPMSVGSWTLGVSSTSTAVVAFCDTLGVLPRVKLGAELAAAASGAPLTVYTATLFSDTAVPVWHEARNELPFLFAAESAATAGAAASLFVPPASARPVRRLAVAGALVAEGIAAGMRRRLGFVGEVYEREEAGRFDRLARAAALSGAALIATRGERSRAAAIAGGALVLGGSLARRFAIFRAGFQSARDPRYTVAPQRARLAERTRSKPA
jgi:hypothetical protein